RPTTWHIWSWVWISRRHVWSSPAWTSTSCSPDRWSTRCPMADLMSMADSRITTVAPGWAVAGLAILGVLVVAAAMLDGALSARAGGGPGTVGGSVRPFGEAARLMRQRRRTTVEAD